MIKKKKVFAIVILAVAFSDSAYALESGLQATDIEAGWNKMHAEMNYDQVIDAYDPVFAVEDYEGELDKEKCHKNYAGLTASAKKLPVSLAINYWAYRCAVSLGKAADEEQYLKNFSQLTKHAFSQSSDFTLAKPIRVLHSSDIYTVIDASGMALVDQYLNLEKFGRYLPWVVSLWDQEKKQQVTYQFDFLDAMSRLSNRESGDYRAYRVAIARSLISAYKDKEWQVGVDAQAALDAAFTADVGKKMEILKPQAQKQLKLSSDSLVSICLAKKDTACAQFVIDSMLDALESQDVQAMVRMAVFYAAGVGVKQDANAAITLLKSAEQLTGEKALALQHFVELQSTKPLVLAMPEKLMAYLDAEGAKPTKQSLLLPLMNMKSTATNFDTVIPQFGMRLANSVKAGNIDLYHLYSLYFLLKKQTPERLQWLEAAAVAGNGRAQLHWAKHLLSLEKPNEQKAAEWMLEAAKNGELAAIQWLTEYYFRNEKWKHAAGWAESGMNYSDLRSSLQLAYIYSLEPEGTDFKESDAVVVYESIAKEHDSVEARYLWARLLLSGRSVKHDPEKAKALLLQDAEKNNAESMALLGSAMLSGAIGKRDIDGGLAWLEKASAKNSQFAKRILAQYWYVEAKDAETRARAKKLWAAIAVKESPSTVNGYAWTLCTSVHADYLDPKTGLGLMNMLDIGKMSAAHRDTYAACLAANGDFTQAVKQQQQVVNEVEKKYGKKDEAFTSMLARLNLYQKNKTYTEVPPPTMP